MEPWIQIGLAIGLLLALPAACAWMLRQAGAAGAAVLGGVLAGVLFGPTIFGRAAPLVYERIFVGGHEQREALESVIARQGADLVAAEHAGFDRQALAQMRRDHAAERAPLEVALDEARWEHQQPLRIFTAVIVAIALVGAALFTIPTSRDSHPWVQRVISPTSIGIWSAAVPGALGYVAAVRWWGWSAAESAIVAAAVMIGPWALTRVDREAADRAEHGGARMIQSAGRVATVIAMIVLAWGFFSMMGWRGALWLLPLLAIAIGWLFRINLQMNADVRGLEERFAAPSRQVHRRLSAFIRGFILPSLAALAAIRIELFAHFAVWPIIILLLLSGDGRWLGAVIGAMLLGGRRSLRTMRLVLGSMACGPTQLAIIALAAHLWMIPDQAVMALVIGAVVIEVSAPLRRSMATRLAEAEEWELE